MPEPAQPIAPTSIFEDAATIIAGDRRQSYGPVHESFQNVADVWNAILRGKARDTITPQQVALMMIGLKLIRESNRPDRDNRVDICGYAGLLDLLQRTHA